MTTSTTSILPAVRIPDLCRLTDSGDTGGLLLKIEGVLDAAASWRIKPLVNQIIEVKRPVVTVNVTRAKQVEGNGMGVLVSLFKGVRRYGGNSVLVVKPDSQPRTVLRLLGFHRTDLLEFREDPPSP